MSIIKQKAMIELIYLILTEALVLYIFVAPGGPLNSKYIDDDNIVYFLLAFTMMLTVYRHKYNWSKWLILIIAHAIYIGLWLLDSQYLFNIHPLFSNQKSTIFETLLMVLPFAFYPLYVIAILKWVRFPVHNNNNNNNR